MRLHALALSSGESKAVCTGMSYIQVGRALCVSKDLVSRGMLESQVCQNGEKLNCTGEIALGRGKNSHKCNLKISKFSKSWHLLNVSPSL